MNIFLLSKATTRVYLLNIPGFNTLKIGVKVNLVICFRKDKAKYIKYKPLVEERYRSPTASGLDADSEIYRRDYAKLYGPLRGG